MIRFRQAGFGPAFAASIFDRWPCSFLPAFAANTFERCPLAPPFALRAGTFFHTEVSKPIRFAPTKRWRGLCRFAVIDILLRCIVK
jgi:hypothetical protein